MSFSKRPVLLLEFGEQAYILNGDDRLISEDPHELDLLLEKRSRLASVHRDGTDDLPLVDHRDAQNASDARDSRGLRHIEVGIRQDVRDVDNGTRLDRARRDATPAWRARERAPKRRRPRRAGISLRDEVDQLAVEPEHRALPRVAQ